MIQLWRARWTSEEGKEREMIFHSVNVYMIARIDFKLKFPHAFFEENIPESFELEEAAHGKHEPGTRATMLLY